ncbi:hypothetical protein RJT34_04032 [Clitoria ternatea]|uniref:Uncharacterized protein n=1 Tax=Clitoria ternatea TaxID=43366 RepID=A0AAN9KN86_CLITE
MNNRNIRIFQRPEESKLRIINKYPILKKKAIYYILDPRKTAVPEKTADSGVELLNQEFSSVSFVSLPHPYFIFIF